MFISLFGFAEVAEDGAEIWGNLAQVMTPIAAYGFLVFNLLCAPCFAAMGAIKREMNNAVEEKAYENQETYQRTQMQKDMILERLREQGCRITRQRQLILDIILEEEDNCQPDMAQLVLEFAEKKTPVAKSPLIGHGTDSKAIRIGHRLKLFSAEENKRIYKEF